MTTFKDGPAKGQTLMLQRAPVLLRVVRDDNLNKWDALDQLDDTPSPHESIFVYRMVEGPTFMHIRRDRRHGGSGIFRGGVYAVLDEQPEDAILRDTSRWRDWANRIGSTLAMDVVRPETEETRA